MYNCTCSIYSKMTQPNVSITSNQLLHWLIRMTPHTRSAHRACWAIPTMSFHPWNPVCWPQKNAGIACSFPRCFVQILEVLEVLNILEYIKYMGFCANIVLEYWLVVYLPLWKIWKSVGMMKFPIYNNIYGKIKNGPNHQPEHIRARFWTIPSFDLHQNLMVNHY